MKVIITLIELRAAVLKVAQDYGKDYVHVRIQMDNEQKITLHGYIDGFSKWFEAANINDLINQMRISKGEKIDQEKIITDVEVEINSEENGNETI